MYALLIAIALLAGPGCVALTARAHVAVVHDDADTGVQAGVALGFGYATERGAVTVATGVATVTPGLGLISAIDYTWLDDHDDDPHLAARGGLHGVLPLIGEPESIGVGGALLTVLRDKRSGKRRTIFATGLEANGGLSTRGPRDARAHSMYVSAGATFEVMLHRRR